VKAAALISAIIPRLIWGKVNSSQFVVRSSFA